MANQYTLHPISAADRFWAKVDKSDDCWLWMGSKGTDGYGKFWINGRDIHASRMAYELTYGPLAPGLLVLHRCDNPLCCRPEHLWAGTHAENSADMAKKGRAATGDRHGSRTHPEKLRRGQSHHSIARPETVLKGEQHPLSKLTSVDVLAIRSAHDSGATLAAIAARYGVTKENIWSIVKRHTWRHI